LLSKLIKSLTEADFAVAVFDLPGHGLSSGERTAIDNFSQYNDCLADFVNAIRPYVKAPYHLIGHSTGAAIILDYILSDREDYFDKVILAAPLERSDWWLLSKIGFSICRHFCDNLPRVFRNISSDKDFLNFLQYHDPLSAKSFSLKWVGAMFEWDKRIEGKNEKNRSITHSTGSGQAVAALNKELNRPILVIQGTKDNIVDWKYNVPLIMSKFHDCEVELIENARHELFNESQQYRDEVFSLIKDYLTK
ncbi:MAG: alpha/beta hydrolase, partial [Phycisphaerae bacterium]